MVKAIENIDCDFKTESVHSNSKNLLKRARAKYFTNSLIHHLVDLNSELQKSYWNTYHCSSVLTQNGNKITGKYCKNRWCLVCNRIRTAVLIKQYSETLLSWKDKYFLTLTIPNVPAEELQSTIKKMSHSFRKLTWTLRKQGLKVICIKKLEVTYNPIRNDYHPHYHLICQSKEIADNIKNQWLKHFPDAEKFLQDIRPADDNSIFELFKYFSKIVTTVKSENDIKIAPDKRRNIYINALNMIFLSVRNMKTFQTYGFIGKKVSEKEEETIEIDANVNDFAVFEWQNELNDWLNLASGEVLSGFVPSDSFKSLLENNIVGNEVSLRVQCNPNEDYLRFKLGLIESKRE